MGYPVVSPGTFPVERDALKAVPFAIAERLELMPLLLRHGRLVVAMEDPTRRPAISELEFTTQTKVVAALAKPGTVLPALAQAYRKHGFEVSANARGEQVSVDGSTLLSQMQADASDAETNSADDKPIEQSDNQLVRLINTMIIEAHEQGVSDIHIELSGKEKSASAFAKTASCATTWSCPPLTVRPWWHASKSCATSTSPERRFMPRTARSTSPSIRPSTSWSCGWPPFPPPTAWKTW